MLKIDINDSELLKYALESGMINLSHIQETMDMNKKNEALEQHPYKIWEGKDGYYHTYLLDEKGGRRHLKRKDKESIENEIYKYSKEKEENPTISDIFYLWIDEKLKYNEISKATYGRYEEDFKRYFLDRKNFGKQKIKNITQDNLEEFIRSAITNYKLTNKSYANLRTLIYGIFRKSRKMIDFNITNFISDMNISKRCFTKVIKEEDEEVFTEEEYPIVVDYLMNNIDIINLGILLMFSTGLRVGELSALKSEDCSLDGTIRVRRTETRYKENGKTVYTIKEFPKTEAGIRDIVLPSSDLWIMRKIRSMNPFGEYVFEKKGKKIRTFSFRKRLYNICDKLNLKRKSPHKIRKTYGSILLDNGIDQRLILSQMGHTDILCTEQHYHRNRKNVARKAEILGNIPELCIKKENA